MKIPFSDSGDRALTRVLALGFAMTLAACGQQAKVPVAVEAPSPAPPKPVSADMPPPPPADRPAVVAEPTPEATVPVAVPPAAPAPPAAPVLSAEQLDRLVAPVALYPDPLLAQLLPASTYPLEVVQASRWAQANKKLQGEDLEKAVASREWAQSVKALCAFPDVLQYMDEHLDWTTQLGDAVLGQEQDVLDAIQRMRAKAQVAGTLKSNDKQTVEVETSGDRTVVVIEPAEPEVIYVPTYDPEVVYYPGSYGYVDWTPGYVGFGLGAAFTSFSWWWWNDCDWHDRRIVVYRDRDDWWGHGHHGRRHCRIDWDDYDWDRVDWRHCDRIRHGDRDIDIRHINIDNIDINHCDWRRADLRKFDWNRVDWRRVNFDRVDLRHGDWRRLDWGRAGITDPALVDRLRNLSPEDRDWMRGRFERARGNQKYKDLLADAQKGRGSPGPGGLGAGGDRWEHDPKHRRGVAYRGPATGFPAMFEKRHSGGGETKDGFRSLVPGGSPTHGLGPRGGGDDKTGGLFGGLRGRDGERDNRSGPGDRGPGGLFSRDGVDKGKGGEVPKGELVKRAPDGMFPGSGAPGRGRDEGLSGRILDGLRGRDGERENRGNSGDRGPGGLFSRDGGDKGKDDNAPKTGRTFEPPKTPSVRQPDRGGSSGGDFNRMLEALRQKGSDNRSRGGFSFDRKDRDHDDKPKFSSPPSFKFSRPDPPRESRSPDRQLFGGSGDKGRDSGRSLGQMFNRDDNRDRSGDSKRPSFGGGSPSFKGFDKRSDDRKMSGGGGGGFKFDGGRSSGGGGHGGGDRRGGDRGGNKRDKDD